jgi:thymidylate kinase
MNKFELRLEDESKQYLDWKEALLLNWEKESEKKILKKLGLKKKPELVIIDGVDGIGKTSIVNKIIEQIEKKGEKVIFNTFKRRRGDNKLFKKPMKETEWKFRKEVVEQINRRLVTYENKDWVIVDKSPYSEYFYQKTPSFDRGYISPYGNYLMEKEIFKYKHIIDNAIVIYLEKDDETCWKNYYNREIKKKDKDHNTLYKMLNRKEYLEMKESFELYQNIYEDTKRYKKVEVLNDEKSWEKVYKTILELSK